MLFFSAPSAASTSHSASFLPNKSKPQNNLTFTRDILRNHEEKNRAGQQLHCSTFAMNSTIVQHVLLPRSNGTLGMNAICSNSWTGLVIACCPIEFLRFQKRECFLQILHGFVLPQVVLNELRWRIDLPAVFPLLSLHFHSLQGLVVFKDIFNYLRSSSPRSRLGNVVLHTCYSFSAVQKLFDPTLRLFQPFCLCPFFFLRQRHFPFFP